MEFKLKPDYEVTKRRFDAFWNQALLDRPPVNIAFPKKNAPPPKPIRAKDYPSVKDMWLDFDGRIDSMIASLEATEFAYDSLPILWPNLGPSIFSAWCGCELEFSEDTSWAVPNVSKPRRDFESVRLDTNSFYFKAIEKFTQKLLDRNNGRYIVGITDLHPGGDHLAAIRGPENLALDMLDDPSWVKDALARCIPEYFAAYGVFYNMVHSAGMPTTSWLGTISDGTYYIPSNDFSCMVSRKMYEEFFLPGVLQECAFFEHSIYHLDGPNALRHLDLLLDIKQLDAVQWVCGAGNFGYHKWVDVYKRIQKAGKSIDLMCDVSELDMVFETLRPEGVWFSSLTGLTSREHAAWAVDRITKWK